MVMLTVYRRARTRKSRSWRRRRSLLRKRCVYALCRMLYVVHVSVCARTRMCVDSFTHCQVAQVQAIKPTVRKDPNEKELQDLRKRHATLDALEKKKVSAFVSRVSRPCAWGRARLLSAAKQGLCSTLFPTYAYTCLRNRGCGRPRKSHCCWAKPAWKRGLQPSKQTAVRPQDGFSKVPNSNLFLNSKAR